MADINIRIGANLSDLEKKLKKAERTLMRTGKKLKEQGQAMTQAISVPLLGIGAAALKSFADLEKFENGLASMMGGAEAARIEMEKLKEIAKDPGLDLNQAVKGSVRLQSVGIAAEQARTTLSQVGNAIALVGGSSDDLDGVTLALQQIGSKGKVFAEEIGQINERMPQVRKAMKDAFGTANTEDIQKMGISSQAFIAGITAELEKLPRATGGMANAFNNAKQATVQALAGIGKTLNETFNITERINATSQKLGELSEAFQKLSPAMQKSIFIFVGLAASIGPVLMLIGQLKISMAAMFGLMKTGVGVFSKFATVIKATNLAQIGLNLSMLANPFVAVAAAVVALVAIMAVLYQKNESVRKALDSLFEVGKAGFKFLLEVGRLVFDLFSSIVKVGWSVAKGIYQIFSAIRQSVFDLVKSIPIVGKVAVFLQEAFQAAHGFIIKLFSNLPAFFAGLSAEARNMGEKLKSYFRKIAISAEILAKKIQKGITIDSAARKELAASIKRLESEKENLADVGEKFGVAFRTAFDAEMSKSLGSFFTTKVKAVKAPTVDAPTASGASIGADSGNSFEGTTKGAKEATAAVIAHKSALVDLSNAQALQTKEIGSNLEALSLVPASMSRIEATMGRLKEKTGLYQEELASFNEGLTNIANQGMNDLANGIGEMAGAMAAGTMSIGDVGRNLVGALAGILGQIGKLAIQTGIATLGIKLALENLNPAAAIAGGIALVALSKFVTAKMSSAVPLAEGGILTKPVFSGGFLAGEAGPEAVIPLDKLDTMLSGSGSKNVNVSGQFQIKGRDLVYVLNKEKAAQNRYS